MNRLILFTMNECESCDKFKPIFLKVVEGNYEYKIINISENAENINISIAFRIRSFPTSVFVKEVNGIEYMKTLVGNVSESFLRRKIDEFFIEELK